MIKQKINNNRNHVKPYKPKIVFYCYKNIISLKIVS